MVVEDNTESLKSTSDDELNTDIGDFEQLEQELNELDNLDLNDLDF